MLAPRAYRLAGLATFDLSGSLASPEPAEASRVGRSWTFRTWRSSGGSILAAAIAVALAGMSGMRHLRKLLSGSSFRVVQLDGSQYTDVVEPQGSDYAHVVQLDRSEYTEIR
jgi:hypothetical protein